MKAPLLLILDGHWYRCVGSQWQQLAAWESNKELDLDLVVSDFSQATSDLQLLDVKPEYAAAVIEKRLRQEGAIDGAAHIIVHARQGVAGGTQMLFTGVPVDEWQQLNIWLEKQPRVLPVFGLPDLMLAQLRGDGRVVMRAGRHFFYLCRSGHRLAFARISAVSEIQDDLAIAMRTLMSGLEKVAGRGGEDTAVIGFDLLASGDATPWQLLSDYPGIALKELAAEQVSMPEAATNSLNPMTHSALVNLRSPAIWKSANPVFDRGLAWLDRHQWSLAMAVGMVAVTLMLTSGVQHMQWRQDSAELTVKLNEVEQVRSQIQMLPSAEQQIAQAGPLLDLLQASAGRTLDASPTQVLSDVQDSRGEQVRILRVGKDAAGWYLDGQVKEGEDAAAIAHLLRQLQLRGYQPEAIKNTDARGGVRSYFSYRLHPAAEEGRSDA